MGEVCGRRSACVWLVSTCAVLSSSFCLLLFDPRFISMFLTEQRYLPPPPVSLHSGSLLHKRMRLLTSPPPRVSSSSRLLLLASPPPLVSSSSRLLLLASPPPRVSFFFSRPSLLHRAPPPPPCSDHPPPHPPPHTRPRTLDRGLPGGSRHGGGAVEGEAGEP